MKNDSFDIYVSTFGNDAGNGSETAPFATPRRALDEVKKLKNAGLDRPVNVLFSAGTYRVKNLNFTPENGGTEEFPVRYAAKGDGEVLFTAGTELSRDDFLPVTDPAVLSRLNERVRDKVRCLDLKKYGLTSDDIGNQCGIAAFDRARFFSDGTLGNNAEIFVGKKRLTVARYPDSGYLKFGESASAASGSFLAFEKGIMDRVLSWKEPENAWIFTKPVYDWLDLTSPFGKIDAEKGGIDFPHISEKECRPDGQYYFYNILEELDREGEYCIDRKNLLVYAILPENDEPVTITTACAKYEEDGFFYTPSLAGRGYLFGQPQQRDDHDAEMISGRVSDVIFDGITFGFCRADIVNLTGDRIAFESCTFTSTYGNAMNLFGDENAVRKCEVSDMGRGGFLICGGDRNTLTHGNSVVEDCCIHDFGQVYPTYQSGLSLYGCGNTARHNEIFNTPHLAFSFDGNDIIFEYNYIHDTTCSSSDAGAFYVGQQWACFGSELRYNLFRNIISRDGHTPIAIYLDDIMSCVKLCGNIVDGCDGFGMLLGGGHFLDVRNNLIINASIDIFYDARGYYDQWAKIYPKHPGNCWDSIAAVPYENEIWKEKYPQMALCKTEDADYLDKYYVGNPGGSVVKNNIFAGKGQRYYVQKPVYEYSEIQSEIVASPFDYNPLTYRVSEEFIRRTGIEWEQIPAEKIGRRI